MGVDVDLLDDGSGSGGEGGVTGGVRGSRVTGRGYCFGSRGATERGDQVRSAGLLIPCREQELGGEEDGLTALVFTREDYILYTYRTGVL
jgi:hypothetical protein